MNNLELILDLKDRLRDALHKLDCQRAKVQDAHAAFHHLSVGEPIRFQHTSDDEFDIAAQMRLLGKARDEARENVRKLGG